MGGGPAEHVGEILSLWAGPAVDRRLVLAEAGRRGWPVLVAPAPHAVTFVGVAESDLVVVGDAADRVVAFQIRVVSGWAGRSTVVELVSAASGVWGACTQRGPRWMRWRTPYGQCEISEAGETAWVTWQHVSAPAGCLVATGQALVDALVADAARDDRWAAAVDRAQAVMGATPAGGPSWLGGQVAALAVQAIADSIGVDPGKVDAAQVREYLAGLHRRVSALEARQARNDHG